jgi:hypothetical protein
MLEVTLESRETTESETLFAILMKARLSFLRDKNLNSSVVHLKDASLKLYGEYI